MPPAEERPSPHPEPGDLSAVDLPLVSVESTWYRFHRRAHDAIHFGRSGDCRFDAPNQEYGALYVAESLEGAFVETFLRDRGLGSCLVTLAAIRDRLAAEISFPGPLRLADLTAEGLAQLGADGRLCTGDYRISRRWALALQQHRDRPDGILYRSRHDPSRRCAAVFDRAAAPSASDLGSLAEARHRALLAGLLDRYRCGLLTQPVPAQAPSVPHHHAEASKKVR